MQKIPTFIPVVAIALIDTNRRILLQKRRAQSSHGGMWEFPGGKIEPRESPESALLREIEEELGLKLSVESLMPVAFSSDPRIPPAPREPYVILLYTCREWQGEPLCLDADALGWFTHAQAVELPMPPLDIPLLRALTSVI